MGKRKSNVLSLCTKIIVYLSVIILNIFYFRPDLIGKYIIEEKFVERLGTILPAIIGVVGVFATVSNNRKGTYKEVVTRERIEWIHDLRDSLAELMEIMEDIEVTGEEKDQTAYKEEMRRVRQLYFRIISSLNVDGEDEDLIEIRAILSLNKYLKDKGLELPLNFKTNELSLNYEDEKKEDLKNNRDKDKYEFYEIKGTSGEVISLFTMIYKDTWEDVKGEAF